MDKAIKIKTIVGSGFWWAWVDTLFAGVLFRNAQNGDVAQIALAGFSLFGCLVCAAMMRHGSPICGALQNDAAAGAMHACGVLASVLFIASGAWNNPAILIAGMLAGAFYSTFATIAWGTQYCMAKGNDTTLCISASFAMACVIGIATMFMAQNVIPWVACSFPLFSFAFWKSIPTNLCDSARINWQKSRTATKTKTDTSFKERLYRYFGIAPIAIAGLALVLISFGYMQPYMASSQGGEPLSSGSALVIVRGIASFALFIAARFLPQTVEAVFKAGFLAIVAGFMLMPFIDAIEAIRVSGYIIMAGYTISDIFVWVLVVRACHANPDNALQIIGIVRQIANGACIFFGMVACRLLQAATSTFAFPHSDAIAVGYLVTVATILIVGNKDVWQLFDSSTQVPCAGQARNLDSRLNVLAEQWQLTPREREVFGYVATGRSQPWIAETLGIAESTAKTHIRHIYQKANVAGKQELIDRVSNA